MSNEDGTGCYTRVVTIPVDVKLDGEVYVATSRIVKGLIVTSKSLTELFLGVSRAMADLTEATQATEKAPETISDS